MDRLKSFLHEIGIGGVALLFGAMLFLKCCPPLIINYEWSSRSTVKKIPHLCPMDVINYLIA